MEEKKGYLRSFFPYAVAAFLIGIVGGFAAVLGPAFVQDLGIDYSNTTWTALAQAISTAAWAPILGKLSDRIGRRRTLLSGLGVFTLGHLLTALANSLPFMLLSRFLVGLGTAALAPVIMAYILTEFPPNAIARGFSMYMLISSSAVVFGPTLGSIMIQRSGWRSMSWLCVILCLLCSLVCLLTCKKDPAPPKGVQKFDRLGAVFVVLFFSLIVCVPSFAQNFGLDAPLFWIILVAAVLSLLGLIWQEKRTTDPILSGRFLKQRTFVYSIIALFLTQGLMQANMTNSIVFASYTHPGSSVLSGLAISVMYLSMALGSALLGPLADRISPKRLLFCSLTLTGIGCGCFLLFRTDTVPAFLALPLGLLGFGLGGNGTIFMKLVLSGLPPEQAGAGSGTFGLFRDVAAPFGVAVFVPLFTNRITAQMALGHGPNDAAVQAFHSLALVEVVCVVGSLIAVSLIPEPNKKRSDINETNR